jgi:hypothetical protein
MPEDDKSNPSVLSVLVPFILEVAIPALEPVNRELMDLRSREPELFPDHDKISFGDSIDQPLLT